MESNSHAIENSNTVFTSDDSGNPTSSSQEHVNQQTDESNPVQNHQQVEDNEDDCKTEISYTIQEDDRNPNSNSPVSNAQLTARARRFFYKIIDRFNDNDVTLKAFVGILQEAKDNSEPLKALFDKICALLRGHDDLVEDFTYFLPGQCPP